MGRLARVLAELHARLRLSRSGSDRRPGALDRLLVTAALLPELSALDRGFVSLGRSLDRLMAAVEDDPALWPDALDRPLESLAEFLEDVLAAADAGAAVPGEEEAWRRQIRLWSGDEEPEGSADELGAAGGLVILVVEGELRRAQIRERVRAAGFEAVAADIDDVRALAEAASAVGILADDLEPGRNLTRLGESGRQRPPGCRLVLCSAGICDPEEETTRAVRAGAAGAWCEPWDPEVLGRILQPPSHP